MVYVVTYKKMGRKNRIEIQAPSQMDAALAAKRILKKNCVIQKIEKKE